MRNYPSNLTENSGKLSKILNSHNKDVEKVHSEKLQTGYSI